MTIVVPENYPDVENLDSNITVENLFNAINTDFQLRLFSTVSIPKFTIETTLGSMAGPLSALGLSSLFEGDGGVNINFKSNLKVDSAVHKALIRVDEEGTEAAAATGLTLAPLSAQLAKAKFIADRPFIYFITSKSSQTILFAGRVVSPQ